MSDFRHECDDWRMEGVGCAKCGPLVIGYNPEAEAKGRADILKRVAELPSPVKRVPHVMIEEDGGGVTQMGWNSHCQWCSVQWPGHYEDIFPHPDNGCIWPEALKAKEGK